MAVRVFASSGYVEVASIPMDAGPITMLALVKRTSATGGFLMSVADSGGTNRDFALEIQDDTTTTGNPQMYVVNTGIPATAVSTAAADGWLLLAVTKASGSSNPRYHKYSLDTDTWTRQNAPDPLFDGPVTPGTDTIRFGLHHNGGRPLACKLALFALYNVALTDGQLDGIATASTTFSLLNTGASDPLGLWEFTQASTGTAVVDLVGDADQVAISGTSVATGDDPAWTFGVPVIITKTGLGIVGP
jgi:hypothetical protein